MKIKILKRDFDRAISVPWDTHTCLIAQALNRIFGSPVKKGFGGASTMTLTDHRTFDITKDVGVELQQQFDHAFKQGELIDPMSLCLLRSALPMTCEVYQVP